MHTVHLLLAFATNILAFEDDIEDIIKQIENEEKKRNEVVVKIIDPPTPR